MGSRHAAAKQERPRPDGIVADRADAAKPLSNSRKSAKKRDAIVRAAIQVINAKSFALATMSEIAATLDLKDAALYYYFPSKQSLVYACHVQSMERFETILRGVDGGALSGGDKIRRFVRDLIDDGMRHGPQIFFGDLSYLDDAQRRAIDEWGARLSATLQRFFEQGMADGSVAKCEAPIVVQLMLGMLIWVPKWVPTFRGMTGDRLMEAIEAFSLQGLGVPPLSENLNSN